MGGYGGGYGGYGAGYGAYAGGYGGGGGGYGSGGGGGGSGASAAYDAQAPATARDERRSSERSTSSQGG
jgi:hypothetical protein